jgi:hypothetical protein
LTTNHACSDREPFRNRIVILDGKDEKISGIKELVYFLDDGQIRSKCENVVVDRTPDYLPFIYKLTNGNPQLIIDQNLLDTKYFKLMCQLKNGVFALDTFALNYTIPQPYRSKRKHEYDDPIPMAILGHV